jgi:hypothetical protein
LPIQSKVVLRRSIGVFLMVVSIWLASCQALLQQFSGNDTGGEQTVGHAYPHVSRMGAGS